MAVYVVDTSVVIQAFIAQTYTVQKPSQTFPENGAIDIHTFPECDR